MELDPKYKLPRMRYKGDAVESQHIRKGKKSLVTEVDDATSDNPDRAELVTPQQTQNKAVPRSPDKPVSPDLLSAKTTTVTADAASATQSGACTTNNVLLFLWITCHINQWPLTV